MSYAAYLRSSHWQGIRQDWVDSGRQTSCIVCGDPNYQLHHKTYERLGCEELDDLEPLCVQHHREKHGLAYEEDVWRRFVRTQSGYRRVFVKHFGPFALHYCYFCGGQLDGHVRPWNSTAVVVHHQDGGPANHHPLNLKPAHLGCHTRHHAKGRFWSSSQRQEMSERRKGAGNPVYGRKASEEERAKRSTATRGSKNPFAGKTHSEEARAKIRKAKSGKELSVAHRAKISEGHKRSPKSSCIYCHRVFGLVNLGRHVEACRKKEKRW